MMLPHLIFPCLLGLVLVPVGVDALPTHAEVLLEDTPGPRTWNGPVCPKSWLEQELKGEPQVMVDPLKLYTYSRTPIAPVDPALPQSEWFVLYAVSALCGILGP